MKNLFSEKKKRLSDLKMSLYLPALYPMRCWLQSVYFQMHETLPAKRGVQIPLLPEKHIQLSYPPTPPQPWDKMSLEIKPSSSHQLLFHKGARAMPRERASSTDNTRTLGVHTRKCHVCREELRTD